VVGWSWRHEWALSGASFGDSRGWEVDCHTTPNNYHPQPYTTSTCLPSLIRYRWGSRSRQGSSNHSYSVDRSCILTIAPVCNLTLSHHTKQSKRAFPADLEWSWTELSSARYGDSCIAFVQIISLCFQFKFCCFALKSLRYLNWMLHSVPARTYIKATVVRTPNVPYITSGNSRRFNVVSERLHTLVWWAQTPWNTWYGGWKWRRNQRSSFTQVVTPSHPVVLWMM
jgi:hypothetical protein